LSTHPSRRLARTRPAIINAAGCPGEGAGKRTPGLSGHSPEPAMMPVGVSPGCPETVLACVPSGEAHPAGRSVGLSLAITRPCKPKVPNSSALSSLN
jgi:hypothetical protein